MSEYTEQAEKFLRDTGTTFRAVFKGDRCPPFCDDEGIYRNRHIHGDRYRVTFARKGVGRMSLDYWNSLNDMQKGIEPTAYDVLACIQKSDPGTLEEFCRDFGYDTDSRKAFTTYKAVCREWRKVERLWTVSELEQAQEIA